MQLSDIYTLQIEPTSHCNARCPHCPRFDKRGNLHEDLVLSHLDIDAIQQNLELKDMTGLSTVILEGDKGDPAMHPKIEQIIDFFAGAPTQPIVKLYTNGSIRSQTWWKNLAEKNLANLQIIFSIDGLKDTNHLYRVGLDYEKIIANVQAFIGAGGHASWKFILFKHNEHQFDEIVSLSKDMGFEEFIYTSCRVGDFDGLDQYPVYIDNQISHYLEQPLQRKEGTIKHISRPSRIFYHIEHRERICPNLSRGLIYITCQNQVIPCCMMHFDTLLDYPGTQQLREMTGGFDQQSLAIYPLSEVLNHKFFKESLHNSLTQGNWHFNCERQCKNTIIENLNYVQSKI